MKGFSTIIIIYATMIIEGEWSWDNVPAVLLPQVEEAYNRIVGEALATHP